MDLERLTGAYAVTIKVDGGRIGDTGYRVEAGGGIIESMHVIADAGDLGDQEGLPWEWCRGDLVTVNNGTIYG